ncbi:MAG: cytochrome c peroxidase [Lacibacter sp.]
MKRLDVLVVLLFFFVQVSCNDFRFTNDRNWIQTEIPDSIRHSFFSDSLNFLTKDKAELGRYLFYDKRLSINKTKSCASCHDPRFAFTDTYRRSVGAYGDLTMFNSPPLFNLAFNRYFTYADSSLHTPEQQIKNPMFADSPVELGWKNNEALLLKRLREDSLYRSLFSRAFPGVDEKELFTVKHVQFAISSFTKTILSFNSRYDDYVYRGKKTALDSGEVRGMLLFQSSRLKCNQCHSGVNLNEPVISGSPHFNTGFFTDTAVHKGVAMNTKNDSDAGKYKTPTLRNLAFTSPYFHDGSVESLQEVVSMFANGNLSKDQNKHPFIQGFNLNLQERNDLIRFLLCLTDSTILHKPQYQNPWEIK